jgi:hypothetical protein
MSIEYFIVELIISSIDYTADAVIGEVVGGLRCTLTDPLINPSDLLGG